jgi:hypothetical protein
MKNASASHRQLATAQAFTRPMRSVTADLASAERMIRPHKPPATLVRTNQAPPFLTSTKRKRVSSGPLAMTHSLALRAYILFRPLLGALLIPPARPVVADCAPARRPFRPGGRVHDALFCGACRGRNQRRPTVAACGLGTCLPSATTWTRPRCICQAPCSAESSPYRREVGSGVTECRIIALPSALRDQASR